MGCDIHVHLERRDERGRYVEIPQVPDEYPLGGRSYSRFAFLAGVRNWANIIPLSSPRGLPHDLSATVREQSDEWDIDGHSHSWLTLHELLTFDYDQPLLFREGGRDPRCTEATYRQLLDEEFLSEVRDLQASGVARVVFWFDN
jgi:hypothetical protein